jgi:pyruvate,water dikinase
MLFDYVAPTLQPGRVGTVWSQFPLQPLAPAVLTPFSYSVLAELAGRGWFVYYDRLGFDPPPGSRLVRRYKGRVYFNLSLSAQLEADHAGLEPLVLQVNRQRQPLATWEKPGFLAGFKLGRAQKKIDELLADYAQQMGGITERARTWYLKTQSIRRWGQAEVLQIMEEIERAGVESMATYWAARSNLERLYARLLADLTGQATPAHGVLLINHALCDIPGLVELAMVDALRKTADAMRGPAQLAWLEAGDFAGWRDTLPSKEAIEQVEAFIGAYGHRALHEGEIARPRWAEDASLLMQNILAHMEAPNTIARQSPANTGMQELLATLPTSARKQGEQLAQKIGDLHSLQSHALHALAYIWAGTRRWALAAAGEAMVDKRLQSEDEVFLYELEEIKQMMTGEWNISSLDEIRTTTAKRRLEHAAAQQEVAPDILVDDDEGFVTHDGLPAVAGQAEGPLRQWELIPQNGDRGAVVGAELLDSGYVLTLPLASGFVAAAGTPFDPFVVAARGWQRPVIVGMGKRYAGLVAGAQTHVDANAESVTVSQSGK